MIISVNINGVLRDILTRFQEIYEKYHDTEVKSEVVTPDLMKYVHFESNDELIDFLYEESPMEVFGQAKESCQNVVQHLMKLYREMPDGYRLRIVSDDLGRGKSSTLWFLAKYGCVCDEIMFYNSLTIDRLWENTDLFITCDTDIIEAKPDGKKLIIVDKIYNKDMGCDKRINNLKEIESLENASS